MYHLYWIIFMVRLYYCCPEDGHFMIYSILFPLTSPYNRARRYFMPEMNHGTKGDHMPRNSINDHSLMGGGLLFHV